MVNRLAVDERMGVYLIALPMLFSLGWVLYQRVFSPLAGVPGPVWASISRLWITRQVRTGNMHRISMELHQKYGKVVRIAPDEVSVTDLNAVKRIYAAGSKFRKSDFYAVWQGQRKFDLFAERNEAVHAQQRKLVNRPYTLDWLKDLEPAFDNVISIFMMRLQDMKNEPIDLGKWFHLLAFDIIGETTFSKRLGYLDAGGDNGAMKQIEDALYSAAWVGQFPWIYRLNSFFAPVIGNHLAIANRHGSIRNFAFREIVGRKDRGSEQKDILGALFAVHHEKPDQFDDAAVVSMATSNIFAGSDTTAISMGSIMYHLLRNPECKNKLLAEIEERQRSGKLNDPVSFDEGTNMKYLQATIYEGIRLFPAVGLSLARIVPAGGYEVDGHFLPTGTTIGVNAWALHHEKSVYGDDADKFRPERWLEADTGDMQRFFFAFGAGSRYCIGKNISWMEITKVIPTILMRYDLELIDPNEPLKENCGWFVFSQGLNVRIRPRLPLE